MLDLIVNGFWCFLWFVCFCYTTDQYRRTDSAAKSLFSTSITNCLRATITFSFFSIILWVCYLVRVGKECLLITFSFSLLYLFPLSPLLFLNPSQIAIIVFNVLFLIWLLRGTDRDCRGLHVSGQEGNEDAPENYDDEEEKKMPQGGDNYTPPEY